VRSSERLNVVLSIQTTRPYQDVDTQFCSAFLDLFNHNCKISLSQVECIYIRDLRIFMVNLSENSIPMYSKTDINPSSTK